MVNLNNSQIEALLLQVFLKRFNLNSELAIKANIQNVDSWDSLSHMDLIIELQEIFNLKNISSDDFANLTSYSLICEYIKNENK